MFDAAVIGLFYAVLGLTLVIGIINWFRSSLFDIRQTKLHKSWMRHPNSRQLKRRALVSIIVFADNDAETIYDCLRSILASSYRKTEVIIIDNASKDDTKLAVKQIIAQNPKRSLRLVAKRRPGKRADPRR